MKKSELTRFIREIASELRAELDDLLDPTDLDDDDTFESAVTTIVESDAHANDLFALARDRDELVSCIALAAIAERRHMPPEFEKWAWRAFRKTTSAQDEFVFRALLVHGKPPLIGRALRTLDESVGHEAVARFVGQRLAGGEAFDADVLDEVSDLADELGELLDDNEELLGPEFRQVFETWRAGSIDTDFLTGIGRMWAPPYDSPPALLSGRRAEIVDAIAERLAESPRRSVLLVGQHGVGKTSLLRAAIDRVGGLAVFEASAAQLQAGAVYVGELEGRIKEFVESFRGRAMVWHLPDLEAALHAGQHTRSRFGMLDALLPAVQAGDLTIVAEALPEAAERLLAERPHLATAFQLVQIRPLEEAESVSVAVHALEHDGYDVAATEDTLRGAYELAEQFLPRISSPGNLLRLVRAATVDAAGKGQREVTESDLVAALAQSSGLPLLMLDASVPLRLEDTREFFARRVLGQNEAVDAVVERIAMIKAGVTDPTRPLGVFLFVGPTGTGKTEIAKALAEFLFGSADRLVRLDMSEFQSPDSFDRLLADTSIDSYGAPLVASIRKDPFAVVLLDEFDKAARPVWDLFLQVFDDGRLTDQHGRVVDLRRCVIILTSNIGSSIATRAGVGFDPTADPFRPESVTRALESSFRPEFRNRIDRIVVFRPFERAQMRALLDKELAAALTRRGLRERPWAVELDDSAYEFIIDQGFSPALGARPLKRALERHLLARLAAFIVEQRAPSGDQFLLVSSPGGDGIEITFVDPDAADSSDEPPRETEATVDTELDLRSLALAPRGESSHTRFLLDELQRIRTAVRSEGVEGRKLAGLAAMTRPDFWEDDSRFATLAEVEYLDRLDTALETAERLCERFGRHGRDDRGGQLHEIVARRLYVLDRALLGIAEGAPADVFLRVREAHEGNERPGSDFPTVLAEMYSGWARRRGMHLERLGSADNQHLFAVSGLGCSTILAAEAGYHVLELSDEREGKRVERETAAVDVVAWDPAPGAGSENLLARAEAALRAAPANPTVVRRYRRQPDALVRDSVRGYRTGRIDRVLAGDFDLF